MTDRPNALRSRLTPALMVVMLLWLAFRESGAIEAGDVFWHLRTGDLILDDGIPTVDPFSWTAGGESWQPNAWLSDVLWAAIRSSLGVAAISILAGLTVIGVALLLYRSAIRAGGGPVAAASVTAIAVIFMSPFIAPRPLLVGFLLAPIAIEAARRYLDGSQRALIGVALLFAAWSNLHGSFVTGVGIVGLIAIGRAIDSKAWRRPLTLAVVSVVAGVANPYGVSAYLHTLDIRDESVNIDEWQPLALDDARGVLLVAFMALIVWAAWRLVRNRSGDPGAANAPVWEELLPAFVLALLPISVIRTGAFFLIVAAPVVAVQLSRVQAAGLRAWARPRQGPLVVGLVVAAVVLAAQQAPELASAGEPSSRFSEEIAQAIPDTCVLLNEYDLGGFIIDRRWPEVSVSQDGRNDLYGADEIERQAGLFAQSSVDGVENAGITCVVADRDRPLAAALEADPLWSVDEESTELVLLVKERPATLAPES